MFTDLNSVQGIFFSKKEKKSYKTVVYIVQECAVHIKRKATHQNINNSGYLSMAGLR